MSGEEKKLDFAGHPVTFYKKGGEYFFLCKGVHIPYSYYTRWKENPSKDSVGFNEEGVECKIRIINNQIVRIGCLRDTKLKFLKIIININKYIRDDKNNGYRSTGKENDY